MAEYAELLFIRKKREYNNRQSSSKNIINNIIEDKLNLIENSNNKVIKENSSSDTTNLELDTSEDNSKKETDKTNSLYYSDNYLLNKAFEILHKFIFIINEDISYQEKNELIKNLALKIKIILNSKANHNSKIFFGVDKLYSRTYFFNLLKIMYYKLKSMEDLDYFSLSQELSSYENFANFFSSKKNSFFKFITNFKNLAIDLLKRELLIYFFMYKDIAENSLIYNCFNISNCNIKYYDNLLSMKIIKKFLLSHLFINTLLYLLSAQGFNNINKDNLIDVIEKEYSYLFIYYIPLPENIISFSLINEKILINNKIKEKSSQVNCQIKIKAILLIILLGEISNLISRKYFYLLNKSEYFEQNLLFDFKEKKNISCFNWIFNYLFGGISYFYESNSKFILDTDNYNRHTYKDFNEFREKLISISLYAPNEEKNKKFEIYDI